MTAAENIPEPQAHLPARVNPQQKKLQVGVVGIGRMGQRHAMNVLRMVPRANLLCACSPAEADLVWAEEHLKPHGVKIFKTFEEMIEMPGLEAVIICSITSLHMQHTTMALDKGIHVLCEKPICCTVEELNTLVERVEANPETKVMVAFVRRFDESYQDAHKKLTQGAIGRPVMFRSQGCEKVDHSPFFKQYLRTSGGIFFDSAIHDIDLALFFFGEDSQPKSVTAAGVAAVHTEIVDLGDADNAVGICEFWDGKIAFFYHSRTAGHGYDNPTEIFGTTGKISINAVPRKNRVEVCDGDGLVKLEPIPGWYERYTDSFVTEANAWVDAVLDDKPMPITARAALTSLKIALALQKSLRTGRRIEFTREGGEKETVSNL